MNTQGGPRGSLVWAGLAAIAVTLIASACTEEKIIYRTPERPPPADQVNKFVGYANPAAKMTACGECHVSYQADWSGTLHTEAWNDLWSSGAAQPFCNGCHAVSEQGNPLVEAGGINVAADSSYYDVQCESCHGPGYAHIENPDRWQPIVSIKVDTATGCGECHQGTQHPYVEEWQESRHAQLDDHAAPNVASGCASCHQARYALQTWGVKATYAEMSGPEMVPITCAVCHDPHANNEEGQLRFSIEATGEDNLCYQCHHKRAVPDPATWRGPHSPQGPMLFGAAGWYPEGFAYGPGDIVGTHGSPANRETCATCHVARWETTDPATGQWKQNVVGHTFEATPWVDAGVNPVPEGTPGATRYYGACATGGCHGSPEAARSAAAAVDTRFDRLVAELWVDLDNDGTFEGTDGGMLPKVPSTEFKTGDNKITVGEGALFNARLMLMKGQRIHNPFLGEALLLASIEAVEKTYGLSASPGLDRTLYAAPPPRLVATK